jgi:Uma2 family endonuclease
MAKSANIFRMSTLQTTTTGQRVVFYPDLPTAVDFGSAFPKMSEEEFFEFCQRMEPMRVERDSNGEIEIMAPTYSDTGGKNFNLAVEFGIWAKNDGRGRGFDSSAGFVLPKGSTRSPDLSWIKKERWDALCDEDRARFAHICPDFVVELRSETDKLVRLKAKMTEYVENGASLGWLIDPIEKKVHIYTAGGAVEVLDNPSEISGEPLLTGFVLKLSAIWG